MTRSHEAAIPLSRPDIGPAEVARVVTALQSGRLALGPQTREFEARMASLTDAKHAVAVSSGTAALHLILEGMGIGPGDEVITTPFSFVATANAAIYVNARPVFADIDPVTFNIDPADAESRITSRTRAIVAVDVFGSPADWPELRRIADRHGLLLVDDGCEALGASVDGHAIGSLADATAFGFYPNKQITTGEGGCVTTSSDELAELCRSMANQGRASNERMNHVRLGYNYRMDEISAALGCAQLERFDVLQERRQTIAARYNELLAPLADDVQIPGSIAGSERSWFAYVIALAPAFTATARDELMSALKARGIESAPYFPCIHLQPLYQDLYGYMRGRFPVAEAISDRTLALPFFTTMKDDDVVQVVSALNEVVPGLQRSTTTISATA